VEQRKKVTIFVLLVVICFALDMGSKIWAQNAVSSSYLDPDTQSSFSMNLNLAFNKGSAFGMFNKTSGGWWFLSIFGLVALYFIYYLFRRPESDHKIYLVGLGFIGGGALGNLVDRIIFGKVTDFLQFWGTPSIEITWPWPTFNVADIALVAGVILLMIYSMIPQKKEPAKVSGKQA
jgi:signal peptidase II